MPIKDPDNPLYGKEWRGVKTYTKYTYTVKDIAKTTGRAIGTVRNDICDGLLRMDELQSVGCYIAYHTKEEGL